MNNQTGDLTITNIRAEHAGSYTLEIITGDEQTIKSFNITVTVAYVVDAGKVKSVSVMEGHSVTLHTDFTDIQTDDKTEWRFKNIRISRIKRSFNINPLYYNDETEIFRDKLKMNNQTGDLTITHITSQHSGLYQLEIIAGDKRTIKSFNITVTATSTVSISESTQTPLSTESSSVSDKVKTDSAMEGISVTLHIVHESSSVPEDPTQPGKTMIYCCVVVGCVMNVAALLMFCICGKHSNTQRHDQTNEDEITYTNLTFYQENKQPKEFMDFLDRQAESEMTEVVYTCYNIRKDRSRLLSDQ
ncbi:uncharacterized protein LOC130429506 isoform X1 [Triplophysa dalaica]|uniref:uncharacterized protein LOC130429506 isoform X1 n=1 Tax=Triplophysa dalaica TaxID=1582913 RepID=UPI0024DFB5DE|nr:uncharacterized protein LOC130429506 isoform X1 [Triplophysa dalaica]